MELYKNDIKSNKVGVIEHKFYIFDDKAVFFVRNKTTGNFKTVSNKINQSTESDNYPTPEYWEDYESIDFDKTKFIFKENRHLTQNYYTNGRLYTVTPRSEDTVYVNELYNISIGRHNEPFWVDISELIPIIVENYLDDLINHIIIETYDGHARENYIKKCFEDTGYCVESINGDEDSIFGIDMKVYKNKKLTYLIQIKPYTAFYKSPKINDALIIDRKR
ncbi:MAG: hypothetical protein EZS28_042804, partial [Streblomastix strix]